MNDLTKRVEQYEKDAVEYLTKIDNANDADRARVAERDLKRSYERMDATVQAINTIYSRFDCLDELAAVGESVTGHTKFESMAGAIVPPQDASVLAVCLACHQFTGALEAKFASRQARAGLLFGVSFSTLVLALAVLIILVLVVTAVV